MISREEYFIDDELDMYKVTERTSDFKLVKIYCANDELIQETKIFYNKNGIPYRIKEWVSSIDGNDINSDFKIPIFPGYEDVTKMTEKDKKRHTRLINDHLMSDFVENYAEEEHPF